MARLRQPGHTTSVVRIDGSPQRIGQAPATGYRASCTCGWKVEPLRTRPDYNAAITAHVAAVAGGRCSICGEPFTENSMPSRPGRRVCGPCKKAADKVYRDRQFAAAPAQARQRSRDATLRSKYGLSPEDIELLFKFQNGRCPICTKKLIPGTKAGMHVDHCHETGIVRGLLCGRCNQALGLLGDDIGAIRRAIDYLNRRPGQLDIFIDRRAPRPVVKRNGTILPAEELRT